MPSDLTKYNPQANGFSLWNQLPNFERDNPGYLPPNSLAQKWYDVGHIVYLSKPNYEWPEDMRSSKLALDAYIEAQGNTIKPNRYYRWLGWDGSESSAYTYDRWQWLPALSNELEITGDFSELMWLIYEPTSSIIED